MSLLCTLGTLHPKPLNLNQEVLGPQLELWDYSPRTSEGPNPGQPSEKGFRCRDYRVRVGLGFRV